MNSLAVIMITTFLIALLAGLILVSAALTRHSRSQWRSRVKNTAEVVKNPEHLERLDVDPETVTFAELWEEDSEGKTPGSENSFDLKMWH